MLAMLGEDEAAMEEVRGYGLAAGGSRMKFVDEFRDPRPDRAGLRRDPAPGRAGRGTTG